MIAVRRYTYIIVIFKYFSTILVRIVYFYMEYTNHKNNR